MARRTGKSPPPSRPQATASPPGLLRRLAAILYDGFLLIGVLFAATLGALALRGGEAFKPGDPLFTAYLLAVCFAFYGWFWTHGGQTLGMRAWKIRVVSLEPGPLTWRQAGIRWVFALVSALCLGLGYFWMLGNGERCGWQDLASGTRVVRD